MRLTAWFAVAVSVAVCPSWSRVAAQQVTAIRAGRLVDVYKSLKRETELVIYPGEYHEIRTPSYQRDRIQRSLACYGRYLKREGVRAATP